MELIFKIIERIIEMIKLYWYRTLDLIFGKTSQKKEPEVEFGEVLASGKGDVEIPLVRLPKLVEAKFKDFVDPVPCNPHHDKLHHSVEKHHHQYLLKLNWHTSAPREIVWIAYF
jgi:hypothetical protein